MNIPLNWIFPGLIIFSTTGIYVKYYHLKLSPLLIILIISFLFTPIFQYLPNQPWQYFFPFVILACLVYFIRQPRKHVLLLVGSILVLVILSLYQTQIITVLIHFQKDNTVLGNWHIETYLPIHQQEALYLPYRLRPLVFGHIAYVYFALGNAFTYLALSDLYNLFLVSNLYPLALGIYYLFSEKNQNLKWFVPLSFLIVIMIMGLTRPVNTINSLWLITPIFIYLILRGFEKVSLKLYLLLLTGSVLLQLIR